MRHGGARSMIQKAFALFKRLETRLRTKLSHHPILYTFIGGVAIVLFWKGVWDTADLFPFFLEGPVLILISFVVLLITGLFVSFFVGDRMILSNLASEERRARKTEETMETEEVTLEEVKSTLQHIDEEIHALKDTEHKPPQEKK